MAKLRAKLARIASYAVETVLADEDKQLAAERLLQEIADCALDVGRRVLAESGLDPGTTARLSFRAMAQAGIIGRQLASDMADYYALRNLLVHGYAAVDDEETAAELPRVQSLVDDYVAAVTDRLQEQAGQGEETST